MISITDTTKQYHEINKTKQKAKTTHKKHYKIQNISKAVNLFVSKVTYTKCTPPLSPSISTQIHKSTNKFISNPPTRNPR